MGWPFLLVLCSILLFFWKKVYNKLKGQKRSKEGFEWTLIV